MRKHAQKPPKKMPRGNKSRVLDPVQQVRKNNLVIKLRKTSEEVLPFRPRSTTTQKIQGQICPMPSMRISSCSDKPSSTPPRLQSQTGGRKLKKKKKKKKNRRDTCFASNRKDDDKSFPWMPVMPDSVFHSVKNTNYEHFKPTAYGSIY